MAFTGHSMFYSLTLVICLWISFDSTHAQREHDLQLVRGILSKFTDLRSAIIERRSDILETAIKPLTDGRLRPSFPHRQHHGHRKNPNVETTPTSPAPQPSSTASSAASQPPSTASSMASQPPSTASPVASQSPQENTPMSETTQKPLENKSTLSTEDWSHVLSGATEEGKSTPESITRKIISVPCRGSLGRDGSCRQDFD